MDTQSLPIVPFGKYKGQPVTDLLKDTQYLEWCKQQEWFKKQTNIYNICVNQTITTTNSDSRTPEHNRLQNLFLNKTNTIQFLRKILFNQTIKVPKSARYNFRTVFESTFNWDISIENITNYKCHERLHDGAYDDIYECDCELDDTKINYFNDICVEIKTLLGDDYPGVLRKMKTQIKLSRNEYMDKDALNEFQRYKYTPTFVLLIKDFNSSTTSKEQLIAIFKQSSIRVVFLNEVFGEDVVSMEEKTSEEKPSIQNQIEDSENTILREKLFQAEQKIKELEEEILLLKKPKNTKTIQHYFTKT